jgi:hypothetical protein
MAAPRPSCSVDNCGKSAAKRGWCSAHYQRWLAHGDPLAGRTPDGEPLRFLREVVLTYEGNDCLTWPYSKTSKGYAQTHIDGKSKIVSRVVCQEAHGDAPTPDHEASHSCGRGNRGCVTKRHLSWKTHADNEADKLLHGTSNRGERHNMAKLTTDDVIAIRSLEGNMASRVIAEQFSVSRQAINDIHSGKRWGWLNG